MTRETRKRELEIGIGLVLYLLAFLISMQAKMKSKAEMLLFLLPYIVSAISIYKEQAEKFLKKQFLEVRRKQKLIQGFQRFILPRMIWIRQKKFLQMRLQSSPEMQKFIVQR